MKNKLDKIIEEVLSKYVINNMTHEETFDFLKMKREKSDFNLIFLNNSYNFEGFAKEDIKDYALKKLARQAMKLKCKYVTKIKYQIYSGKSKIKSSEQYFDYCLIFIEGTGLIEKIESKIIVPDSYHNNNKKSIILLGDKNKNQST